MGLPWQSEPPPAPLLTLLVEELAEDAPGPAALLDAPPAPPLPLLAAPSAAALPSPPQPWSASRLPSAPTQRKPLPIAMTRGYRLGGDAVNRARPPAPPRLLGLDLTSGPRPSRASG